MAAIEAIEATPMSANDDETPPAGCALIGLIAAGSLVLPLFLIALATLWRLCWRVWMVSG